MVEVDVDWEHSDGVTLVRTRVRNTRRTAQRVTLVSRLEPVWPPRRGRIAAPAWDGDTWAGAVEPGRTRGVGFASPAGPPDGPPVELVGTESTDGPGEQDPLAVLASLEEWVPPSDAVDR